MILTIRAQILLVSFSFLVPLSLWALGLLGTLIDFNSVLIFVAVFFGSVVVGAAGFGSAAVAGAIMLFFFVPVSAVPILIAASFTTQLISLGQLWHMLRWRGALPLLVGGFVGIPIGVLILQTIKPDAFQIAFGLFLLSWSGYLLTRPHLQLPRPSVLADVLAGATGGITGGAIAFPGAFPAIWCAITRKTKEEQRGTIQAFILVMQFCTLTYLIMKGLVGSGFVADYFKMLPAITLGTFAGVHIFTRVNEASFRRLILVLLLIAGTAHILAVVLPHLEASVR